MAIIGDGPVPKVIPVDFQDRKKEETYCENAIDYGNGMICMKPNCDGIHHFYVSVDEPIPFEVPD